MARVLALATGKPTDDDAASLFEQVTERFRDEAQILLAECQDYLEEADLPRMGDASEKQLRASREAHRVAVRLKDLIRRTFILHAWSSGMISTNEAFASSNRLQFRDYCLDGADAAVSDLPLRLRNLCADSLALYERTCDLEDTLLGLHGLSDDQTEAA